MMLRPSSVWPVVLAIPAIVLVTIAGCAEPSRNLYEGIRTRDDAMRGPVEKATHPSQPYENYEKQRPGKGE